VVLPESDDDVVVVRPLGATDVETTGILTALEPVEPATFPLPDPAQVGDARSARLLRDALRLGFRSSAGPFRSFGSIAVEPRPYQLVPLLMALRLDPVRLLIADDVGIGKTIESALIAKELLEQGDATRLAVLCPPHLAEQWQAELSSKFHLDAELVLASTAGRLERGLPVGRTIFDTYPYVIVSTDYIKSDKRRADFVRTCPELVIVDEAHTCAVDDDGRNRGRQQRHQLLRELADDETRHLILVTATPHSGKQGAFRSLLGLLDPAFRDLPDDLGGEANRRHRERLAAHLVQRRRGHIRDYLGDDTMFPDRLEREETYRLSSAYASLFDDVLAFARETVRDPAEGDRRRQRVRWWSALALLRAMASSPAAAAKTMRTRAAPADTATVAEADEIGRLTVLDLGDDVDAEVSDVVPGADDEADESEEARTRRRLRTFAKRAEDLHGDDDEKLVAGTKHVKRLLNDGFRPIVFCRFIDTANYVADELRARLPKGVDVVAVTGELPPAEREARVAAMADSPKRVLVATDCLSEGINLQELFDAVVHYDLPWNPTRLEQREGRVDRFGQVVPEVRALTLYGADNQIDEIVLRVLLRKHRAIRKALGISVPVPGDESAVMDAVAENLLLTQDGAITDQRALPGMEEWLRPRTEDLLDEWDRAADAEKASRSLFAQHGIKVEEVAAEVDAVRRAIGRSADVEAFVRSAIPAVGGLVRAGSDRVAVEIDLSDARRPLREAVGTDRLVGRFDLPVPDDEAYLGRTHPFVASLASYVLDSALDALADSPARRCGAMRTTAVKERTVVVVARQRFHLVRTIGGVEHPLLAEDAGILAFTGSPTAPVWLSADAVGAVLDAEPGGNVTPDAARDFVAEVLAAAGSWRPDVDADALRHADELLDAHERVRQAARQRGVRHRVEPQLPADVLGVYVLLPVLGGRN
jgi:superfamily II DNA or RNA helicase